MKKYSSKDFFEKLKISNLLICDPIYSYQTIINEREAEEILDIGILNFFLNKHGIKQCIWEEYLNYNGDYLEFFRCNKKNKNGSNCKFNLITEHGTWPHLDFYIFYNYIYQNKKPFGRCPIHGVNKF